MRFAALVLAAVTVAARAGAQDATQLALQQLNLMMMQQAAQRTAEGAAEAAERGRRPSEVIAPAMSTDGSAAIPTLWPKPDSYRQSVTVTISDMTPFATVYYTTDGSEPTVRSARYTGPITLSKSSKLLAMVVAPGFWQSPIAIGNYDIR